MMKHIHVNKGMKTNNPVDTGRKLNVHKTFRRRPGRLLNILCTLNLRPVSTGKTYKLILIYLSNTIDSLKKIMSIQNILNILFYLFENAVTRIAKKKLLRAISAHENSHLKHW